MAPFSRYPMKDSVKEIVGKRIVGVVAKCRLRPPTYQLFLAFDDGTWFEFYCPDSIIVATSGVVPGSFEEMRRYMGEEAIVREVYRPDLVRGETDTPPDDEDPEGGEDGSPGDIEGEGQLP